MCFDYLDRFSFKADPANLAVNKNSVKKRFIHKVLNNFGLDVVNSLSAEELANTYTTKLDAYILPLDTEKMAMHQISKRTNQGGQNG